MAKRTAQPAKISRPEAHQALLRPRLFEAIEAHREARMLWLQGPPGAGKTVLVSSYLKVRKRPGLWLQLDAGEADLASFFHYLSLAAQVANTRQRKPLPALTPEYLAGVEVYTRRFAEALSQRLPAGSIIVLDNYEQVPKDAPLHTVLPALAESLGQDVQLWILSREAPPFALARLRLHGALQELDPALLSLTLGETQALTGRIKTSLSPETLLSETGGWMAGVVLLLAQGQTPTQAPTQVLFDYFAAEFFATLPEPIQQGLVMSALLPAMTANQVIALSGEPDLGEVLVDLHHRNYFVTERQGNAGLYEYHPLFRQFLLTEAQRRFTPDRWQAVQCKAATLLVEAGQSVAAARLFREAGDGERLAALLLNVAPRWLAEGRHLTLSELLQSLPPETFTAQPWLRFWQGRAQLALNPPAAYTELLQTFEDFKPLGDTVGLYCTWVALLEIHAFMIQYDISLEARYQDVLWLRTQHPVFPSVDLELQVTSGIAVIAYVKGDYALLDTSVKRCEALWESEATPAVRVVALLQVAIALPWAGQVSRAIQLLTRLDPLARTSDFPPAFFIMYLLACGNVWVFSGDALTSLTFSAEAEQQMETKGIVGFAWQVIGNRVVAGLVTGATAITATSLALLQSTPPGQPFLKSVITYWDALHLAQQCDLTAAIARMREAVALVDTTIHAPFQRYLRVLLGWLHVLNDGDAEAEASFTEVRTTDGHCPDPFSGPLLTMAEADRAYRQGREAVGDAKLTQALALGRAGDYAVWGIMGPHVVAPLYQLALQRGVEPDFVRTLVRRTDIASPDPTDPHWPWAVRIQTLGRFLITVDDNPLTFQGKIQHKPLDLLKALIALGGRNISETQLMEAVWPDSEGDTGLALVRTNVYRLRQLLRHEEALKVEGGRVSLNPNRIWVDALAFLDTGKVIESVSTSALRARVQAYVGPFLPGESAGWCLATREHLRSQYLRLVERLGDRLEVEGDTQALIDLYLDVVRIDPIAEDCYRRLMQIYASLDQRAEAVALYQRCRQALLSRLGCTPSQAVQALYQQLKSM